MAELSRPGAARRPLSGEEVTGEPVATPSRRLDIVGRRNVFFAISLLIIVPGIISMLTRGFLLGIDFQGGTELFLKFSQPANQAQVEAVVASENVNGTVQKGANGTYIVRTRALDPAQQKKIVDDLDSKVAPIDRSQIQANQVGPSVAREIVTSALLAVLAAAILILLYLAFRFRRVRGGWRAGFQFGGSALLALLHDVFLLTGIFSILGKVLNLRIGEIDSLFLTAALTVVGFSVHDTIVVFDRIRENLVLSDRLGASRLTFEQVVNLSILQTAARSIITSFTVLLVLAALLLFGGQTLQGFVLALLIGILSGTYSSIFNASQLLVVWRKLQPVT